MDDHHHQDQYFQQQFYGIVLLNALSGVCFADAQAQPPYSAPSTAPGLAPAPASPTPAASQTPLAPSPSPADSCSTVSSLGPGNYRVYGTKDALVQGPTTTLLCPGKLTCSCFKQEALTFCPRASCCCYVAFQCSLSTTVSAVQHPSSPLQVFCRKTTHSVSLLSC